MTPDITLEQALKGLSKVWIGALVVEADKIAKTIVDLGVESDKFRIAMELFFLGIHELSAKATPRRGRWGSGALTRPKVVPGRVCFMRPWRKDRLLGPKNLKRGYNRTIAEVP